MLKAMIAGVTALAHGEAEVPGREPVTRMCAYLEAVGACVLIAGVAVLLI